MGQPQSIPYDILYQEWLNKKCVHTLPIYKDAFSVGVLHVKPETNFDTFPEMNDNDTSFITVKYSLPFPHVALLLYRKNHPTYNEPVMEYIDSMASLSNGPQAFLEFNMSKILDERGIIFLDSAHMYNGDKMSYNGVNYVWEPPQSLENLLVNNPNRTDLETYRKSIEPYEAKTMPDLGRVKKYLKSLQYFDGGDCVRWCHQMAEDMIQNNIDSREWMKNFMEETIQSPESVTMYSIRKLLESLAKCVLAKKRYQLERDKIMLSFDKSVHENIHTAKKMNI